MNVPEVVKVPEIYWLDVNAMTQPMQVREDSPLYALPSEEVNQE